MLFRSIFGVRTAGDEDAIKAEVIGGADAIQKATGLMPKWYRGATALYSPEALPLIQSLGFSVAGFSLNADEGASLSAGAVTERMKRAHHGDVIIAHMNQPHLPSGAGVIAGIGFVSGCVRWTAYFMVRSEKVAPGASSRPATTCDQSSAARCGTERAGRADNKKGRRRPALWVVQTVSASGGGADPSGHRPAGAVRQSRLGCLDWLRLLQR